MNALLAMCMIVSATSVWAGEEYPRLVKSPVKEGSTVTVDSVTAMHDSRGKPPKQTVPAMRSGTLRSSSATAARPHARAGAHLPLVKATFTGDTPVPRASGPNARTVAEIVTRCDELKDQPVLVRGKVVKYLPEIMGLNWVHLRDGTGSAVDNSNDLVVTTTNETRVGDTVTVRGIVRTDIDFGSGYAYKVLIDEATLQ
jgi:hypothetical protein